MTRYTFKDMPDQTTDGVKREINAGLAKIAFHMITSWGLPKELVQEELDAMTTPELMHFYMEFRTQYPSVFA